jgi:hypothetical protein
MKTKSHIAELQNHIYVILASTLWQQNAMRSGDGLLNSYIISSTHKQQSPTCLQFLEFFYLKDQIKLTMNCE